MSNQKQKSVLDRVSQLVGTNNKLGKLLSGYSKLKEANYISSHFSTYLTPSIAHDEELKNEVYKIELKGKDGSNYIYTITSFEINKEIPDAKFRFNTAKHPEVEVIDLR